MKELGNGFDGTLSKAIESSKLASGKPKWLQDYMLAGDFKIGTIKKVDEKNLIDDEADANLQNFAAQLATLDRSQQNAVFKISDLNDAAKNATQSLLEETAAGDKLSASVMQSKLESNHFSKELANQVLKQAELVDSMGNYLVVGDEWKSTTGKNAEESLAAALAATQFKSAVEATSMSEKELAASIIVETKAAQVQTAATWAQKLALDALRGTIAIVNQLAISLGIAFVSWVGSKVVDYIKNIKTQSERLVETMNESHDAAQQATKDVEEIQSKIDEPDNSLTAHGRCLVSKVRPHWKNFYIRFFQDTSQLSGFCGQNMKKRSNRRFLPTVCTHNKKICSQPIKTVKNRFEQIIL